MTTDNKIYFRLSASLQDPDNPTSVVLENMDGSKVSPHIQQAIGRLLQEQAEQREYVYIAKTYKPEQQGYKVGRTKDLTRRERELGMQIVLTIPCDVGGDFSAIKLETMLHELYDLAGLRINREWFDLNWWDIELLRVFFNEDNLKEQTVSSFVTFRLAVDNIKNNRVHTEGKSIPKILGDILFLWKALSEACTHIFLAYQIRELCLQGIISENLYRSAIEEAICLEQNFWDNRHIRPIEKTFEEAVTYYLKSQFVTP